MNFIKEKIINFWSNPELYVYIHRIGELIYVKKTKYNIISIDNWARLKTINMCTL